MQDERDLVTVSEAAQMLGLTPRGILNRLERGDMRGYRVTARLWLVPLSEVERWQAIGRLKPGRKQRSTKEGDREQ